MGLLSGPMCEEMFGATTANPFPGFFGILSNSWLGLAIAAMATSLLILVLIYMIAMFLRNQQLLSWTKFELYQVLATAVVVIFTIMVIAYGMCSFDMSFLGASADPAIPNRYIGPSGPMNMLEIIDKYFGEMEDVGILLFGYLMYVVKQINFLAQVMWLSSPLGVGSSESPLGSLSQVNSLLFLMVSGYVISFMLLQLQMRMLEYLAIALLYFIYPFGIFFRAFEPTRAFGGTLIGLSIALFLFYPIILVFNDYIIYKALDATKAELGGALNSANLANQFGSNQATADYLNSEAVRIAYEPNTALRNAEIAGFSSGITGGILFLLKPIMMYFIGAVVLPVINFILLVEITRGITRFFGDEIDITNLTRMI